MSAPSIARLALGVLALASAALAGASGMPIVLLKSDTTSAHFRAAGRNYEDLVVAWRHLFTRQKLAAHELHAAELASQKQPAVLIVASALALSDAERGAIRERLRQGWSVLMTGASGVLDGRGQRAGYGFIEEVSGAQVAAEAPPDKDGYFLLPYGDTPLTHRLGAGRRISLAEAGQPLLRIKAAHPAARLGSYVRDVMPPAALLATASFDERGGARRAFFGFSETSWTGAHLADMDALMGATLDWLRRKPAAALGAWPDPYQAALLLEMDTEDKFANGALFAAQLERFGLRGTFFVLTSEAVKHPNVLKRLAARHEIAYHADVHDGFAKVDPGRQAARLRAMTAQLGTLLPQAAKPRGFRPPREEYDEHTLEALRAQGLGYIAASGDARADMLPGFSPEGARDGLVVLARTWADDISLLRAGELDNMQAVLLASLGDTVAMRGLGLLSIHSQHFASGSPVERALPVLLEAIVKQPALWAAPGEAIEQWWRDRAAVALSARAEGTDLAITLRAAHPVKRLRVLVMPPRSEAKPRLEAGVPGGARIERLDEHRWAIVVPELSGEARLRVGF